MSSAKLRSQEWFGRTGKDGFIYRAWMKNQGIPDEEFRGKPVIGICNTWSELTPCNGHFRELAESVKRGVIAAGGFPVEFPVMSLGETIIRPTAMLYRNLAAMTVEESIRGNPFDAIVLLTGCDKTTPSLVMGAASCDLPTIVVVVPFALFILLFSTYLMLNFVNQPLTKDRIVSSLFVIVIVVL